MNQTLRTSGTGNILELRGIEKSFPGVRALKSVSFSCRAGEVHALMGENGAGKSTLVRIIAGIWQPDAGEVLVRETPVRIANPRVGSDLGIAMVHQDTRLVPDLDVARNIWLGREPGGAVAIDLAKMRRDSLALLNRLGMAIDVTQPVSSLSVSERQIVEIARALTSKPAVLILDEPTSALDAGEIERLFDIVRNLRDDGTSVIFISHRLPEVFAIADRITVLKDGESVGTVERSSVTHEDLVSMMVGRALALAYPPRGTDFGSVRFAVEDLAVEGAFSGIGFSVRAGEILGLGGIQGNGQSDVPRAVFGVLGYKGTVRLDGEIATLDSPAKAIASGVVYMPADRRNDGLFMSHSIAENISLPHLFGWSRLGLVPAAQERETALKAIERFAIKTPGADRPVNTLSGGNQQKVVLGRWTSASPRIYLFEDPTRGVDVAAKLEIYRQIRALSAAGAAVILVSSDLLELIGLSDRIMVFHRGRIVDEVAGADATEERIVGSAVGAHQERTAEKVTVVNAATPQAVDRSRSLFLARYGSSLLLAALLVVLAIATASYSEFFLKPNNLANIASQVAPLALVALGQFLVIVLGGIDLSVGPLISLVTGIVSFLAVGETGADFSTAVTVSLAAGLAVGMTNGAMIVALKIPDLIATLATYSIVFGLALTVRPSPGGLVSAYFIDTLSFEISRIPLAAVVVVLLCVGCEYILLRGSAGQRLYAVGSSAEAGYVVGINTNLVRFAAYAICGLCAAGAGLLVAARIGSGDPQAGTSFTLASVTAVVIGGASVFGGRGTAIGTLVGAIAVGIMQNALNLMHVSAYYQYIWTGALTLIAVGGYSIRSRRT